MSEKMDLQFSQNNLNKCKCIFTILAHIIPRIRFTKNIQNLLSKFTCQYLVLT